MEAEKVDTRPQADCFAKAIRLFSEGAREIVCTKIKLRAGSIPNKEMRLVCTTERQVRNFYEGK